ncbi:hypothetical protein Mal48_34120 [Thalassoglobus polymorphus]|uniref:Uncharacterized protein n=1 Tax=Thalassoglobus polymorphus TaxID=2527994 RepID=A0A517QR95_9PLAN|nr:hypothetical protein Mal48_34120 [Thalassoglobus polymorphus]
MIFGEQLRGLSALESTARLLSKEMIQKIEVGILATELIQGESDMNKGLHTKHAANKDFFDRNRGAVGGEPI